MMLGIAASREEKQPLSSLLLKTHRAPLFARLRKIREEGASLQQERPEPLSVLEYEHALDVVEDWLDRARTVFVSGFEDERVGEDVLSDLGKALTSHKKIISSGSELPHGYLVIAQEIGRAVVKIDRLIANMNRYREPPSNTKGQARKGQAGQTPAKGGVVKSSSKARPVFISHSARDEVLAGKLVDLLTAAMKPPLVKADILCTSVPGCRLEGGAQTHERIREEIKSARVFIAVITGVSVDSEYVLFELGARWALGGETIPILGPGEQYDRIPGPLRGNVHALRVEERTDVLQLVDDVARTLGRTAQPGQGWDAQAQAVIKHGGP